MNICIVTVYNSINCGSFWQAKALGEVLRNIGIDVCYFKRKNDIYSSSFIGNQIKTVIGTFLKYGVDCAIVDIDSFKRFKKEQKCFKCIGKNKIDTVDMVLLGSDTIWNVREKFFYKWRDVFWGKCFQKDKICTYAVSIADSMCELEFNKNDYTEYVSRYKNISVRDDMTKEFVGSLTNKKVIKVCDPVWLLNKGVYYDFIELHSTEKYIYLYSFAKHDENMICNIIKFASNHEMRVLSSSSYAFKHDRKAIEKVINSPNDFLHYIYHSNYVITDTYHGIIFSILFQKEFAIIKNGKNKVLDLITDFNLEERVVGENCDFESVLRKRVDYERINKLKDKLVHQSLDYINQIVNDFKKYEE